MEQKTKFIIFGLIGFALIGYVLFVQTLSSKQLLMREKEDLKRENSTLNGKMSKIETSLRDSESKVGVLNQEIDRIAREKSDLQKKLDAANKEKEAFIEKMKSRAAEAERVSQPTMEIPSAAPGQDAYWAQIIKSKTDLEFQLGSLRDELKLVQVNNEKLQRDKGVIELDMANLAREKDDLKRQLDYSQKLIDGISKELVVERNDKMQIKDTLKSLKGENTMLIRQVKGLNTHRAALEKKIQDLDAQKAAAEQKMRDMELRLTDKMTQIGALQENIEGITSLPAARKESAEGKGSVELPPIVVRPSDSGDTNTARARSGKILAVNKESNFVIIDLGDDAGINIGDKFSVFRNDKVIAAIEVIQTRKNISACDVKKESTPVKVGDNFR